MITDEKLIEKMIQFIKADRVFFEDNDGTWRTCKPLSIHVAQDGKKHFHGYGEGGECHLEDFELEKPEPKREFEDGGLYPVIHTGGEDVVKYSAEVESFFLDVESFDESDLSFIGDKLPPELWESK